MAIPYRAEIDGLRAVAVIPVILLHAGFSLFRGGFVGVDVFFVISGYLITRIIVRDLEADAFSFLGFYERRARRIAPALTVVLLSCIPVAWMLMLPKDLQDFSESLVAVSLFLSNLLFYSQSGYFDGAAEMKPLLHTWSLAVEEQFYIIFPPAVLLLWRLVWKSVIFIIAFISIISFSLSEYATRVVPSFSFYMLPTRAWELLIGALCSFVKSESNKGRDNLLSAAGFAAIVTSVFWYDENVPFPSAFTLLPVLGACAVLLFARQGTIVHSLLSLGALRGIGLISYSAYLWHQPLFAFARIWSVDEPSWVTMLGLSFATLILAYLTWRFVEVPARRRGNEVVADRKRFFAATGIAATVFAAAGLVGSLSAGFPERLPKSVQSFLENATRQNPRGECIGIVSEQACIYGNKNAAQFALVGDSHAHAIAFQLGELIGNLDQGLIELTKSGCPPIKSYNIEADNKDCSKFHSDVLRVLENSDDIRTVIVFSRWTLYTELDRFNNREGGVEKGKRIIPKIDGVSVEQNSDLLQKKISDLISESVQDIINIGKNVVIIYPQPEVGWEVPAYVAKFLVRGAENDMSLSTSYDVFIGRSKRAYSALDKIGVSSKLIRIYPELLFCNNLINNRCAIYDGEASYYRDDDHVNEFGASLIAAETLKQIRARGWLDPL